MARQVTFSFVANVQGVQRGLASAKKSIASFGKQMTAVGKDLTLHLTAPVAAFGATVLNISGGFESSMKRVQAVSGETGASFMALEGLAKELGATTVFTARQAAQGMESLARAGFSANEIMESLPATLSLAAATGIELGQSSKIAAGVLRGFQLEAKDMAMAADVLAQTTAKSNVDITELSEAMKFAAPVATVAGQSFKDTAAIIGVLGNANIQGTLAGTGLNAAITRLLKPSREAKRAIESLGIEIIDTSGTMLPLIDIIRQLEERQNSAASSAQFTADVMGLFGRIAGPKMLALIGQGAGAIEALREKLDENGVSSQMAQKMMEGLFGSLILLRSAFEGLAIAIGEAGLLSFATGAVQAVTSVVLAIRDLDPAILAVGSVVGGLVVVIGPLLLAIGSLSAFMPIVSGGLLALGGTLSGVIAPVGAVVLGIVGLVAMFKVMISENGKVRDLLLSYWADLKAFLLGTWKTIQREGTRAWDFLSQTVHSLMADLGDDVMKILEALRQVWDIFYENITSSGVTSWDRIKLIFEIALETIADLIRVISGVITGDWEQVMKGMGNIVLNLSRLILDVFHQMAIDIAASMSTWFGKELFDPQPMFDKLDKMRDDTMVKLDGWKRELGKLGTQAGAALYGNMAGQGNVGLSQMDQTFVDIKNMVQQRTNEIRKVVDSSGQTTWSNLAAGAEEGLGALRKTIDESGAITWAPLKKAAEDGMESVRQAIEEKSEFIWRPISEKTEQALKGFEGATAGTMKGVADTVGTHSPQIAAGFEQIGEAATSAKEGTVDQFAGVSQGAKDILIPMMEDIEKHASERFKGMADGVEEGTDAAKESMDELGTKTTDIQATIREAMDFTAAVESTKGFGSALGDLGRQFETQVNWLRSSATHAEAVRQTQGLLAISTSSYSRILEAASSGQFELAEQLARTANIGEGYVRQIQNAALATKLLSGETVKINTDLVDMDEVERNLAEALGVTTSDLAGQIESQKTKIGSLRNLTLRLDETEKSERKLGGGVRSTADDMDAAGGSISGLGGAVSNLGQQMDLAGGSVQRLVPELETMSDGLSGLDDAFSGMSSNIIDTDSAIKNLATQMSVSSGPLDEYASQIGAVFRVFEDLADVADDVQLPGVSKTNRTPSKPPEISAGIRVSMPNASPGISMRARNSTPINSHVPVAGLDDAVGDALPTLDTFGDMLQDVETKMKDVNKAISNSIRGFRDYEKALRSIERDIASSLDDIKDTAPELDDYKNALDEIKTGMEEVVGLAHSSQPALGDYGSKLNLIERTMRNIMSLQSGMSFAMPRTPDQITTIGTTPSSPIINLNVSGSVTTENDLVETFRNAMNRQNFINARGMVL